MGYVTIVASAVNQAFQQGGRLSRRQLINVLSQLAALPKGYYDVANTVAGNARQGLVSRAIRKREKLKKIAGEREGKIRR